MSKQNLREIFNHLQDFAGSALKVLRVSMNKKLSKAKKILPNIKLVEDGDAVISFEQFCSVCKFLKVEVTTALKCAQILQESTMLSDKELLKEIIDDVDFELWKRDQS